MRVRGRVEDVGRTRRPTARPASPRGKPRRQTLTARARLIDPIASHRTTDCRVQADVTRVSPPAVAARAGKIGLRSIPAALASTIGFFGLGSITHTWTWLVSAPRITHAEVAAEDSLRPTSGSPRSARSDVGRRRHPRHADRVQRVIAASTTLSDRTFPERILSDLI